MKMSIDHIEKAILEASPKDQQRLLNDLQRLLRIPAAQLGLLKSQKIPLSFGIIPMIPVMTPYKQLNNVQHL